LLLSNGGVLRMGLSVSCRSCSSFSLEDDDFIDFTGVTNGGVRSDDVDPPSSMMGVVTMSSKSYMEKTNEEKWGGKKGKTNEPGWNRSTYPSHGL